MYDNGARQTINQITLLNRVNARPVTRSGKTLISVNYAKNVDFFSVFRDFQRRVPHLVHASDPKERAHW